VSNRPAVEYTGVVWGDARVGNIIFDDDLAVAAMVDWEGASVGPPEIDVGWWLMFETYLCEAQGLARPAGIPGRDATVARYEELAGRSLVDIGYFEILAGLVFSLINSRIAQLLVAEGRVPEGIAAEYVTRVTTLTRRWLER
jgi:aminoglycoside phosphotransferase (APT) family kinase protein